MSHKASKFINPPSGPQRGFRCTVFVAFLLFCVVCVAPTAADTVTANSYSDLTTLISGAVSGVERTIIIGQDITVTSALDFTGKQIVLTVPQNSPKTLYFNAINLFITVPSGSRLTIQNNGSAGVLTLDGQYYDLSSGSSRISISSGGSFTMNGGVIQNIVTDSNALYTDGSFVMNDGTIRNNVGRYGGGVHVASRGSFTMNNGLITNNTATVRGGGVHATGPFTMNGGVISGNTAQGVGGGGGVFDNTGSTGSSFTMSGGVIRDNLATEGGGVRVGSFHQFTMSGGSIINNTASSQGGGVYLVQSSRFTMSDSIITGNRAVEGGGVYAGYSDTLSPVPSGVANFTMNSNSSITANSATNGSGVYVGRDGIFTMSYSGISGNTASGFGNGVYVAQNGNVILCGDASLDGSTELYLDSGFTISLPYTGQVGNIRGSVITNGYDLISVTGSAPASSFRTRFTLSDPNFTLRPNNADTGLVVAANGMPQVNSSRVSVAWQNSSVVNVTFSLTGENGAERTYLNMTSGADTRSILYPTPVSAGGSVSNYQISGLVPGVSYTLLITPLNATVGRTPNTYENLSAWVLPYPDVMNFTANGTAVTASAMALQNLTSVSFAAEVLNGSMVLANEPVAWSVSDPAGILSLSNVSGPATVVTANKAGTAVLTVSHDISGTGSVLSRNLTITVPGESPVIDGGSVVVTPQNSTVVNVTFTLTGENGADSVYINLTSVSGPSLSEFYVVEIPAGGTVSDFQVPGLVPNTSYELSITPVNSSAVTAPVSYVYPLEYVSPLPDAILLFSGGSEVTLTSVLVSQRTSVSFAAEVLNGSMVLVHEPVAWSVIDPDGILSLSNVSGSMADVTANKVGTAVLTVSHAVTGTGDVITRNLTIIVPVEPPVIDGSSVVVTPQNSTVVNVTFTLTGENGADSVYVNLTSVSGPPLSELFVVEIPANGTVSDFQVPGLVPNTSYELSITPVNSSAVTTPVSYVYPLEYVSPLPDAIRLFSGGSEVTSMSFPIGEASVFFTAEVLNGSMVLVHEPVVWSVADPEGSVGLSVGGDFVAVVTANKAGTAVLTVSHAVAGTGDVITKNLILMVPAVPVPTFVPRSEAFSDGNMENAFRVLFDAKGGSFVQPATGLSYGDRIAEPVAPTRNGYTFGGWYKNEACTIAWIFREDAVPGDMTLYAKWLPGNAAATAAAVSTQMPTVKATQQQTVMQTMTPTGVSTVSSTVPADAWPTMVEAPVPVAGLLFGLLGAVFLLCRRD